MSTVHQNQHYKYGTVQPRHTSPQMIMLKKYVVAATFIGKNAATAEILCLRSSILVNLPLD